MIENTAYVATETKWITSIPDHWNVKRLKYVTCPRKDVSSTGEEELLSVTEGRGIVRRRDIRSDDETLSRSDDLVGYRMVSPGDLVNNIMLVWKRGLGVSPFSGIVSPAYSVFKFDEHQHPQYFNYLLRSDEYIAEFRRNSTGITMSRLRLYDDSFGNVYAHVPPLDEQRLIARYLDKKTQQIDTLIEKIEKKIELLKEQRTSLINHYVTKGLDPNVEMKDSGVEWIGKIPKHWELKKIKHLSFVKRGSSPRPIDDPKYFSDDGEYSWVRISDVSASEKYLIETKERLSTLGASLSTKRHPGDLFLSIAGTIGKPIITRIKCCIHDGFVWFDNLRTDTEFLYYAFLTGTCFQGLGKMGTQLNLNTETVGDILIPLSTPDEQRQIVAHIVATVERLDSVTANETRRLNLLSEYRQSLISSVVTGKVRVTEDMV